MRISFEQRHSAGHKLNYRDSWGGDSGSDSDNGGYSGGNDYSGPMSSGWDGSGATSLLGDYSNEGRYSAPVGVAPGQVQSAQGGWYGSGSGWSVDANGNVVGNLQAASRDLGVPVSSLGINGGTQGLLSALGSASPFGMLVKGLAYAQDNWGLPAYAMTAEERAQQADARSGRGGSQSPLGAVGMMQQLAQNQTPASTWNTTQGINQAGLFNSPMSGLPGVNYKAPDIPTMQSNTQAKGLWEMLRQLYGA